MCAHAVRVAIKKVPGVESVDVSLERAVTDIHLKPGNEVTLAQVRGILERSGFNGREATVTAVGRLFEKDGQLLLDLAPAKMLLTVSAEKGSSAAERAGSIARGAAQRVELTGVVKQGEALSLTAIAEK